LYGNPYILVTWLDNHDFEPNNNWNRRYGGSDENLTTFINFSLPREEFLMYIIELN